MIKILIVDDHAIVRKGLIEIARDADDIMVNDEAESGPEALAKISEDHYDVVVLDISMPGQSGLEVLKQIKKEKPGLSVLMLSIYPEEQYAINAIKAGASGYLTKKSAPKELIAAIRKVFKGGKYVSPTLAEKLADHLQEAEETPLHVTLSEREFQVMIMLAEGKRLKDIANAFFISEKTVSTYRARVLEKMNMTSNADLTRYALQHGLID